MEYYNTLINIYQPIVNEAFEQSKRLTAPKSIETLEDHPKHIVAHAKMCFETIARLYYLRHGFEGFDSYMMFFLIHLANISMEALRANPRPSVIEAIRATALLSLKGINDQASSYCAAEAAFLVMEKLLDPADIIRLRAYLSPNEAVKDPTAIQDLVNSKWPIPIIYADSDPKLSFLETLVKNTAETSLGPSRITELDEETSSSSGTT
jgi:hypothetical protein